MQTNEYQAIKLTLDKQTELMKQKQFYQSVINLMEARLLPQSESFLSSQIGIVLPANWPNDSKMEYGEKEQKLLCQKFLILFDAKLKSAYHDYKENKGTVTEGSMKIFTNAIETLPVSTAECEHGFSQMNIICSPFRSIITTMHLSSLMYIALVGHPVHLWNPLPNVKSWLVTGHRDATAINSRSKTRKKKMIAQLGSVFGKYYSQ